MQCGAQYIGQSGNKCLKELISTYRIGRRRGKKPGSTKDPPSAVTRHVVACREYDGETNSHFRMMSRASNLTMRHILEAIYIKTYQPSICKQMDQLYELSIPWWWCVFLSLMTVYSFTPFFFCVRVSVMSERRLVWVCVMRSLCTFNFINCCACI